MKATIELTQEDIERAIHCYLDDMISEGMTIRQTIWVVDSTPNGPDRYTVIVNYDNGLPF